MQFPTIAEHNMPASVQTAAPELATPFAVAIKPYICAHVLFVSPETTWRGPHTIYLRWSLQRQLTAPFTVCARSPATGTGASAEPTVPGTVRAETNSS